MLKRATNGVLSLHESSTYPRGYASGSASPAALLDDLFEQPADESEPVCEDKGPRPASSLFNF